jgi:iron complex outermembrane receptor protein/hemoglobin/transferrin/lactoferrin receptor protein
VGNFLRALRFSTRLRTSIVTMAALLGAVSEAAAEGEEVAEVDEEETGDETIVIVDDGPELLPGRAGSQVSRRELDERQPRSAPDALRWEPGVYVQQTAAAQGSAYLRGRTGQQTLLLFDGVRLNNSLWRQGPNQYFFTIDARTLAAIEVVRGGASTRYGSDAIGGVLDAIPRDPRFDGRRVQPRVEMRWGSADQEVGGRVESNVRVTDDLAVLAGLGYRDVSLLESGGPVEGDDGQPALVPRFLDDGRTQLGTGFTEAAWDARLVWRKTDTTRLTAGYYDYRQLDAPRTDQCPPAYAPPSECLVFDEQFHTMGYLALDADLGPRARGARLVVSAQEQHERRTRARPLSEVENSGRDDVRTLGVAANATAELPAGAALDYGADLYGDLVDSVAWLRFTDIDYVRYDSRGQYLAGSRYTTGGAFAQGELPRRRWTARAGGRVGVASAYAPGDEASATTGIDRTWLTHAAFVGGELRVRRGLALLATLDQSFRAPNLDDLTGRQAAGPGFQFENPTLVPERSLTAELGVRLRGARGDVEAWVYASRLDDAIVREQRSIEDCPPAAQDCQSSWFRYQLVNVDGATVIGAEAAGELELGPAELRGTIAWARGEDAAGVPLSRIPPLNGTAEVRAPWAWGFVSTGLRWATAQRRLAQSDQGDPRIPLGGTPGYAVLDLRAGLRLQEHARLGIVVENLGDAAYRYHGSSVNGPGRSVIVWVELIP